jgi:hypothetical protein
VRRKGPAAALFIIIVMVLISVGCGNGSVGYTLDDLSVVNKNGQTLKYGMSRLAIERILGAPDEIWENIVYYNNDANDDYTITVIYRDNIAAAININSCAGDEWKTPKGIGIGSSKEDLIKAYGFDDSYIIANSPITYDLWLYEDGNALKNAGRDRGRMENGGIVTLPFDYSISFQLDDITGDVARIIIVDYMFATRFR